MYVRTYILEYVRIRRGAPLCVLITTYILYLFYSVVIELVPSCGQDMAVCATICPALVYLHCVIYWDTVHVYMCRASRIPK